MVLDYYGGNTMVKRLKKQKSKLEKLIELLIKNKIIKKEDLI